MQAKQERQTFKLVREILALGMEWREPRPHARTAINAFYDPIGKRLYTTYSTGLIQREKLPIDHRRFWMSTSQGPVNRIKKTKMQSIFGGGSYIQHSCIKLYTEAERLERLLECLKTVRKRQMKSK